MSYQHVVTLKAMRFHAHVGVLPHEAEIAQSIEVDLSVWTGTGASAKRRDSIVDYTQLYDLVAGVVARGHIRYLEELVDSIADGALAISGVTRVEVKARKPHVALPGPLMHAEVSTERARA